MAGAKQNIASGVQTIDALVGLFSWNQLNLTYNFPASVDYYNPDTYFTDGTVPGNPTFDFATFQSITPSLAAAIDKAIASELMAVAPLVFTKVGTGAAADSSFAMASLFNDAETGAPPGGIGYYPGAVQRGGDAWFNVDQPRFNNVQIGNSAYYAVLHELGHTVGLKHGHDNDRPGPTMDLLPYDVNSIEFSVMTYRHYVGAPDIPVANDTQADSFPQSLMMYDIATIQYLYGANFSFNSSNTVYTFSPTTGEMFVNGVGQGVPQGDRIFRTIWDGNGTDTYDLSNYTTNLNIDLAPGGWSTFDSAQLAQLSISNNVYARGNVANALQYQGDARSLIENATGGIGNDTIKGNAAPNVLTGNGGNDTLWGFDGIDTLLGSTGTDTLHGGVGADILNGGSDNDILDGGVGADRLIGGPGFDFATYQNATSGVAASLASPAGNTGEAAGDIYGFAFPVIVDIEGLIGSAFADKLGGDGHANELRGGAGNDMLFGLGGNDRLLGGAGNDTLAGGPGNDTFVYQKGGGSDTIKDWQDQRSLNQDVISFEGLHFSMANLSIAYEGGNAIVSIIGTPDTITIFNAPVGSIGADDFLF